MITETFVQKPDKLVFANPSFLGYEQVVFCLHTETGLKASIKYNFAESFKRTENIYIATIDILKLAEKNSISTHQAALAVAQERIELARKNKK